MVENFTNSSVKSSPRIQELTSNPEGLRTFPVSVRVSPTRSDTEFSPFARVEIKNRFRNDI